MHLKRFRAATVRDALRAVRADLGPDALVLSTSLVSAGGLRGMVGIREVEITAAVERQPSDERPPQTEIRQHASVDRSVANVAAKLIATGLDPALAHEVAASLPASVRRDASAAQLKTALASRLGALTASTDRYARAEVFVGPPGAGKTTTIAKIAAQERARGGARLGLVTADGFRVGAVEQLQTYADILGAPFQVARTADDLDATLSSSGQAPILVDTAGRSPADAASREVFRVIGNGDGVRTHLVLPAATPVSNARRIIDAYADARPSRVVLSKCDEAESLNPLVELLRERGLPLSYLGTGQQVPDDSARATGELLAASIFGEAPWQPAMS